MMLPLCTSVTEGLSLSIAYWIALRTSRSVPSLRDRLDADARGVREADLLDAQLVLQELDQLLRLVALGLELDAGVDVFRVLAEDDHVGLLGRLHRRRHAGEVLDRAQADVEVEFLAQRDVERADAAADRRRQRALDRDHVVAHRLERLRRQPDVGAVDLASTSRRRRPPSSGSSSCRRRPWRPRRRRP